MATMRNKEGNLDMQKQDGMRKRWKQHKFKVSGSTYLLYFKTGNMGKPDGQLLLPSVTRVDVCSVKGANFPFEVHFSGKAMSGNSHSPWILNASSNEERLQWMETIKPGSSASLRAFSGRGTVRLDEEQFHVSPAPSYPPPQLHQPDHASVQWPQSNCPKLPIPKERPPSNFDPSKSWHGRPNFNRTADNGRSASIPNTEEPQPYLEPEHFPVLPEDSCATMPPRPRNGASLVPAPGPYNSRSIPRNFGRQENRDGSRGGEFIHTNGGHQYPGQGYQQRPVVSDRGQTQRGSVSHDTRSPPPKPPSRSSTDSDIHSPTFLLDESDDPYEIMMSSPVRSKRVAATELPKSVDRQQKPKPKPRKQSSPKIKLASPPARQQTSPNDYVELCGDSGAMVQDEGTSVMTSSITQLSQVIGTNDRGDVVPEDLAGSFTPDQLQLLINMLQKVQAVQSGEEVSPPSPGNLGAGGQGGEGGGLLTPTSPRGTVYGAGDYADLRGNLKRAISYAPDLPEEQILITDDDGSYLPRPDWAKATGASALPLYGDTSDLHVDSALSDLEEEALYITRNSLSDFDPIGEGQFGKVYKALLKSGVEPVQVAVKTAKKSSTAKEREEFMREMTIMSQMVHPNIVRLYGVVQEDGQSPWIVLEYLTNGDLKRFLTKNQRPVKQLVKYMIDISMGMHYLAEKGLVHRDLAARNILVAQDETCKVADFGLLREIPKDDSIYLMHTNVPCPIRWMAPESISQRKFSTASDVWSFGVLQWEMFNPKKMPYGSIGNMEIAMKVGAGFRLPVPRNIPPVVARIMKACWHKNPEKRPSFLLISTLLTTKVTFDSSIAEH